MLVADGTPIALGAAGVGGAHGEAVTLANGDILVTWTNTVDPAFPGPGSDTSATAVLGRIFAPDGTPRSEAFQVNSTDYLYQQDAEVTVLENGNFVIAWTDMPFGSTVADARAQVFTQEGVPVGGEILLAETMDGEQRIPQIAATPDGGFMAVWNDDRAESFGRFFNADGTPASDEFIVGNLFGERLSSLVVLDDGSIRYVADEDLWRSDGEIVDVGGTDVLNAFSVSSQDTNMEQQFETAMAQISDSRYVIAGVRDYYGTQIVAYVRDAADYDNAIIPEGDYLPMIVVSDDSFPYAAQNLVNVDVTGLSGGGFVVVWSQYVGTGDDVSFEIRARAYGENLNPLGDVITVYEGSSGMQGQPFVTETDDGHIFIGWTDTSGTISAVPSEIVGQFFSISAGGSTTEPTDGNDTLTGTAGNDVIEAMAGDDSVMGLGGNDRLFGEEGNDTLFGGDGRDRLEGGDGDDLLDGGDLGDILIGGNGNDTIFGGQGADVLRGFSGDDEMHGGDTSDRILGYDGNDTLNGDEGNDTLRGGNDDDIAHGGVGNDVVIGGTGRDTLYGDEDDDIIRGTGGFDTVDGGVGNDSVYGGAQADLVLGGAGDDTVSGGGGFDTLNGGTGDDELTGNFNADQFVFEDGHGNDTITDFGATNDFERIDLSAVSAITGLADLELGSAGSGAATQVGSDVLIDTGGGNSILLLNVDLADLDVYDFTF